jgi:FlaA1/EpsC-like NDP-sugar epimerase
MNRYLQLAGDRGNGFSVQRNRLVAFLLGWPRPAKRLLMIGADLIVVPLALWGAFALKYDSLVDGLGRSPWLFVGVTAASMVIFGMSGLYRAVVRFIGIRVLFSVLAGTLASAVVLWILGHTVTERILPVSVVAIFWLLALVWVSGTRVLARWLLTPLNVNGRRVVIYGAGDAGAQLSMALAAGREYQILAYVDEKRALHGTLMNNLPVIAPGDLTEFVRQYQVERVLLAVPSASRRRKADILRWLETLGVHVQSVPSLADVMAGRARVDELREVDIADLLGRDPVPPNNELLDASIRSKSVMISGAGGSIGSELCRQIILLAPRRLVLFEMSEIALYRIEQELRGMVQARQLQVEIHALLGNAHHKYRVRDVMQAYQVQTVYHAAAYKHVPIVEQNLIEGVHNNVFSTWHAAEAALETGVETFVLISTDKAVNPTNVMGATKRLAEIVLQSLQTQTKRTRFCIVRFGNVLGSSGSVVPLFQEQIHRGGPVTVTHRDVRRFFMTIPEAAQLVLQAGSIGTGGDVFVLDMGELVQIDELAQRMIRLSGLSVRDAEHLDGDIEIRYTGLRPGEKLYEELLIGSNVTGTGHPRIMRAIEPAPGWNEARELLEELAVAVNRIDCPRVLEVLTRAVPQYRRAPVIHDLVWSQTAAAGGEAASIGARSSVSVLAEHRVHKPPPTGVH